MEIKNRLFPYPVLCGDTDDYTESASFVLVPNVRETAGDLLFDYQYELQCPSLEELIGFGQAKYVLHIECSATAFRTALISGRPRIQYSLPKARVSGEIHLVAMIVAAMDVARYGSADLNADYDGVNLSFKKGSILAYQNLPPVYVTKRTEELKKQESFFTVVKQVSLDPNEAKPLSFDLHNDRIRILVDQKTYESFIRYQHTPAIALSMLVLPALVYMILTVRESPEALAQYQWYQRMDKYYRAQGGSFAENILNSEENPVDLAQELLNNPVSSAYSVLSDMEG